MSLADIINLGLFLLSGSGLLLFFAYPAILAGLSWQRKNPAPKDSGDPPFVSLVVVVRNGEHLIEQKIKNSLALDYPTNRLEVVVYSDGSTDRTEEIVLAFAFAEQVRLASSQSHLGKIHAMNAVSGTCSGDILVFSDADALLERDGLKKLVSPFSQPDIGGVCGQRMIVGKKTSFKSAQSGYIRMDSWIKEMETRIGSITANDGKLYAVRRHLFRPIPQAVTDDFFVCLSVLAQKQRFVFEPKALVQISTPSKDPGHELIRRRRIVTGSLRCLYFNRSLLNPFEFGLLSIKLFINKGLRRLTPFFLIFILTTSAFLYSAFDAFKFITLVQLAGYTIALCHPVLLKINLLPGPVQRISSLGYYFLIGNWGTLLAWADIIQGKKVEKWDPLKEGFNSKRKDRITDQRKGRRK